MCPARVFTLRLVAETNGSVSAILNYLIIHSNVPLLVFYLQIKCPRQNGKYSFLLMQELTDHSQFLDREIFHS